MAAKPLTAEQKAALATFRERMGGISDAKKEHERAVRTARAAIRKQLAAAPATVPAIAAAIALPAHEILWHLTAMRKYGLVGEVGEDDSYPQYALVDATVAPARDP